MAGRRLFLILVRKVLKISSVRRVSDTVVLACFIGPCMVRADGYKPCLALRLPLGIIMSFFLLFSHELL